VHLRFNFTLTFAASHFFSLSLRRCILCSVLLYDAPVSLFKFLLFRPPGYGFEVNATTEGLTKGLWLHHWQALDHGPDVMVDTIIGQQRNNSSSSSRTLPFECTHNGGGGSEQCAATPAVATLLLDSEGLGAPGGDLRGYDSKLVRTKMRSQCVCYC